MKTKRRTTFALASVAVLPLALAGCTEKSTASTDDITVTASDDTCDVSADSGTTGNSTFQVTNNGTKVTEFYVFAEGDRAMGEVENIGPGLSRTFHVEVSEGGTYQTACKPGMVGDGIRADFVVTGDAGSSQDADQKLAEATDSYQRYVGSQTEALLTRTQEFVDAVKAGDVATAQSLFPVARTYWERIEPVAESFGDLDPKIDGREEVIAEGLEFTGFHRIERDLWVDGIQPDTAAMADRLMADVTEIVELASTVELNPLQLANGAKGLLDEVATGKITGEEDRYSHTDLWDFRANVDGSQAAIASLRPVLEERAPELVATLDERFAELDALLEAQRAGDGFVLYTDLTPDEVKALSTALDAVSEPVSQVAGVVAES